MKTSKHAKSAHEIQIVDTIWDAFEQMADEMGTDREGLVNQAMFMFARLNGFLMPVAAAGAVAQTPATSAPMSETAAPVEESAPAVPAAVKVSAKPEAKPAAAKAPEVD
ncbi:MAG: FHA domain-containing protein, partial [Myxococcaceae bacterium]|nr:FHA domain-containing protein [Myxococcaceae bacterium]